MYKLLTLWYTLMQWVVYNLMRWQCKWWKAAWYISHGHVTCLEITDWLANVMIRWAAGKTAITQEVLTVYWHILCYTRYHYLHGEWCVRGLYDNEGLSCMRVWCVGVYGWGCLARVCIVATVSYLCLSHWCSVLFASLRECVLIFFLTIEYRVECRVECQIGWRSLVA